MELSSKKNGGTCSAVGCSMRRGTNLLSQVKMFSFPRDPTRRKAWGIALKRANWTPTDNSLLCNAHFITGKPADKNDINNPDWVPSLNLGYEKKSTKPCLCETHTKKLKNVSCLNQRNKTSKQDIRNVGKISTSTPIVANSQKTETLKNSFYESSENICATDSPLTRWTYSKADQAYRNSLNEKNTDINFATEQNSSSAKETFTYKNLVTNLLLIRKPNSYWSISPHPNFVICARWSKDYTCEKKVVIEDSLIVRAFLKEWEINLSGLMNITCIDDVSHLLEKVETYKILKCQELE